MHSTACKKQPLSSEAFALIKFLPEKASSLPAGEMYMRTMGLFSYEPADRKETLDARFRARNQRVVDTDTRHLGLQEGWFFRPEQRKRHLCLPLGLTPPAGRACRHPAYSAQSYAGSQNASAQGETPRRLSWCLQSHNPCFSVQNRKRGGSPRSR